MKANDLRVSCIVPNNTERMLITLDEISETEILLELEDTWENVFCKVRLDRESAQAVAGILEDFLLASEDKLKELE